MHFFSGKLVLVILLSSSCAQYAAAKTNLKKKGHKNTIAVHAAQIYTFGTAQTKAPLNYGDPVQVPNQKGLSFDHNVYKNLRVGLEYESWTALQLIETKETPAAKEYTYRKNYRMIDLNISYRYNHFKHHKINIGGGPSYAKGIDAFDRDIKLPPGVYQLDFVFPYYYPVHYFGVQTFIKYDYVFMHGRLTAGAEVKYRRYAGMSYSQVNYGLHAGFNF